MPTFKEDVRLENHDLIVSDAADRKVVHVFGEVGTVHVGNGGNGGELQVRGTLGPSAIVLTGDTATIVAGVVNNEGHVIVRDIGGHDAIHLDGSNATVRVGGEGTEGDLTVRDEPGRNVFQFSAETATLNIGADQHEGAVVVRDHEGNQSVRLNGYDATLTIGGSKQGTLRVRDIQGREAIQLNGSDASVNMGGDGLAGDLVVRDVTGDEVFHVYGNTALLVVGGDSNAGDIVVRDASGVDRIALHGADGDIQLLGADLAEDFDALAPIAPGAVVIATAVDRVAPATTACDRRVVGVASGAGNFKPALRLGSRPGATRLPVAIVGRVYCQADAGHGAIVPGDLLTTSTTAGHAMRVGDPAAAAGAILGKALGPLADGTGLIPVLLTLG